MINLIILLETLGLMSIPVGFFLLMFIKITPKKITSSTIGDKDK